MASYAIKRLFWTLPVLFFISLITFVLMHLVPGGPWDASGRPVSETLEAQLRVKYGLDQPLTEQFGTYMWNLLQGDLGISFSLQGRSVTSILFDGLKVSAVLGLLAFLFAITVGIPLGVLAALKRNKFADYASMSFAGQLAEKGWFPPALAPWGPTAVFAIIGLALLRRFGTNPAQ